VFAKARSAQSVIDALTNGRVSVSANPDDPRVELYADLNQDGLMDMMMGDNANAPSNPVTFVVRLVGGGIPGASYHVRVVKNGDAFGAYDTNPSTNSVSFTDIPAATARTYYRVEVDGPQTPYPQVPNSMALSGNMVALSNPIYFNFDPDFESAISSGLNWAAAWPSFAASLPRLGSRHRGSLNAKVIPLTGGTLTAPVAAGVPP